MRIFKLNILNDSELEEYLRAELYLYKKQEKVLIEENFKLYEKLRLANQQIEKLQANQTIKVVNLEDKER